MHKKKQPNIHFSVSKGVENPHQYYDDPHVAIDFGSPFGRYPTFHILTSVGWRKAFIMSKSLLPFLAVLKFCSVNKLVTFIEKLNLQSAL